MRIWMRLVIERWEVKACLKGLLVTISTAGPDKMAIEAHLMVVALMLEGILAGSLVRPVRLSKVSGEKMRMKMISTAHGQVERSGS